MGPFQGSGCEGGDRSEVADPSGSIKRGRSEPIQGGRSDGADPRWRGGRSGVAGLRGGISEWAEALGADLWGPFRGGGGGGGRLEEDRSVGAEAVGAGSSRVDLWKRTDCYLETERTAVAWHQIIGRTINGSSNHHSQSKQAKGEHADKQAIALANKHACHQ